MDPESISDLAERFFAAISRGDLAEVEACYTPDATIWHNYDQIDQARADNLKVLGWLVRTLPDVAYTEVRRSVVDDGFVQQHVLRATAPGGPLVVPAMMRIACAEHDGELRIARIEEYLDTGQLAVLRG